jgi:hypothetical protein
MFVSFVQTSFLKGGDPDDYFHFLLDQRATRRRERTKYLLPEHFPVCVARSASERLHAAFSPPARAAATS